MNDEKSPYRSSPSVELEFEKLGAFTVVRPKTTVSIVDLLSALAKHGLRIAREEEFDTFAKKHLDANHVGPIDWYLIHTHYGYRPIYHKGAFQTVYVEWEDVLSVPASWKMLLIPDKT